MSLSKMSPDTFGVFLNSHAFERIYDQMTADFKWRMKKEEFVQNVSDFTNDTNEFRLKNKNQLEPGKTRYQWVDEETEKMVIVGFDDNKEIIGLQFDFDPKFDSDEVYTKLKYQFPFVGEWLILWGGASSFLNYHYPHPHQRYAYDFLIQKNGKSYDGNPESLQSYHAFGHKVAAPRAGEVVNVRTNIPDHKPFFSNMEQPEGNFIIIKHSDDEYSMLAHLRAQSVKVEVGDTVEAGQVIAECGNSGASDIPHLHFHVMDSENPYDSHAIRIQFDSGKEPVQGDFVTGVAN